MQKSLIHRTKMCITNQNELLWRRFLMKHIKRKLAEVIPNVSVISWVTYVVFCGEQRQHTASLVLMWQLGGVYFLRLKVILYLGTRLTTDTTYTLFTDNSLCVS